MKREITLSTMFVSLNTHSNFNFVFYGGRNLELIPSFRCDQYFLVRSDGSLINLIIRGTPAKLGIFLTKDLIIFLGNSNSIRITNFWIQIHTGKTHFKKIAIEGVSNVPTLSFYLRISWIMCKFVFEFKLYICTSFSEDCFP